MTVSVGDRLPERRFTIGLADLVRYAGAGGDFNPIHWHRTTARRVGLPDVIAHGMYTMAIAGRFVTDWVGDAGALEEFDVRFSAPVPVPDEGRTALTISGTVVAVREDGRAEVELAASSDGVDLLRGARAVVRL